MTSMPAAATHRANRGRSGLSPIPQLRRDGIEKSVTISPARRPRTTLSIDPLNQPSYSLAERPRLRQQAAYEKRLVREVEEEARVHNHAVLREQLEDQVFFGAR